MKSRKHRITAIILLMVMGINCFGSGVPAGKVYATEYEKASEEAEAEIRAAEENAGEESDETGSTEAVTSEETATEEPVYEEMTITTETTLQEDMEVGNLTINSPLHLNGHKLVVHGDVTLNAWLSIEEGYLVIEGNYKEEYYAILEMESVNDYIQVQKDFIYCSSYRYGRQVNKGTVEVKGNIHGVNDNYCSGSVVFGKECKVLLSGNTKQEIDIRTDSNLKFNQIVIENTSGEGVLSKHILNCDTITDENQKFHYGIKGEFGETLEEDKVIEGDYTLLGGILNLDGHTLTVKGNLIHAGGRIELNSGNLIVEGDYRKQSVFEDEEETVYEHSAGNLCMMDEKDYVLIKGDYIDSGINNTGDNFTAGTLELKGSLRAEDNLVHPLFASKDKHIVKLTGNGMQIIETGKRYTGDRIRFANLVISQGDSGSTEFVSEIAVTSSVSHESANIKGITNLENAVILSPDFFGDVNIQTNYTFNSDVTIHGNLKLNYRHLTINNCHVSITENVSCCQEAISVMGDKGLFTVYKDFKVIYNAGGSVLNSGIMEIGGSFLSDNQGNFECREKAEVHFIGNTLQKIDLKSTNAMFVNVVVDNPEGVLVSDGITVMNVTSKQGVLSYASGGVHGFTVEEDGEYDGDLLIAGGELNLNGHKLHVKGNLTISRGMLNMTNADDLLIVDGNFKTTSSLKHYGKLTEGILEVKGDFTQEGDTESFKTENHHTVTLTGTKKQTVIMNGSSFVNLTMDNAEGVCFPKEVSVCGTVKQNNTNVEGNLCITSATVFEDNTYNGTVSICESVTLSTPMKINGDLIINGRIMVSGSMSVGGNVTVTEGGGTQHNKDFKLELNGTSKQTITMSGSRWIFGTLILNNSSEEGIYIAKDLFYEEIDNSHGTKVTFANGGTLGYTLMKDEVMEQDFVLSAGCMDLNGHTLTVKGNLMQNGGALTVNNGSLVVEGDYYLAKCNKEDGTYSYTESASQLVMEKEEDEVTIKGNLYSATSSSIYKAGTMKLMGNFTNYNANFRMEPGFKLVLNGTKQQELSFKDGQVQLGALCIENEKGIKCTNGKNLCLTGELKANRNPVEGWLYINADGVIKEDYIKGNVIWATNSKLKKDLFVEGDVNLHYLNLNGCHLTVSGNCAMNNHYYNGYSNQTNGILEIKGNLLYPDYYYAYTGSGSNQVILSGSKKQTIYANDFKTSFHELIIANTSEEGVYSESLFNCDSLSDPEHKLSFSIEGEAGYTLTKDTVINGDFTLLTGTMDLNGHKLTVTGNLTQRNGTIAIHGGNLEVYGTYTLGNQDVNGYYRNTMANLVMDNKEDYVCFHQDAVFAPSTDIASYLTAGTMEVKEDFSFYDNRGYLLSMGRELHTIFSGDKKQTISDMTGYNHLRFGTLDIQNTSKEGVVVTSDLMFTNPVIGNGNINGIEGKTLYWNNDSDFPLERWNGNLYLFTDTLLSHDLMVEGTLTNDGTMDLNGKHVIVKDMNVNAPLNVNEGILQVKNNLNLNENASKLSMEQDKDIVQVTGDFNAGRGKINLTAGNLDIKGNVNINGATVAADNTHITTLSGKTTSRGTAYIQAVTINNAVLNKLVLTKPREYYVFNSDVEGMCKELVDDIRDITPPSVPKGLSVSDIRYTSLKLSWQEASDDTAVAGYDIYRNEKKIMSVTGTSYTDKNLIQGVEYSYYVVAKDATLNTSAASAAVTATTLEDREAPEVPTGLELKERTGNALTFTWNPSKDNVKTFAYTIYRNGEKIGTANQAEYTDTGLKENSNYNYSISAYDINGNDSALSEETSFYTQAVEIAEMTPVNYAELSGTNTELRVCFKNAGSAEGYKVYMGYREKGAKDYTEILSKTAGKGTSYNKMLSAAAYLETEKIAGEEVEVVVRITDSSGYETEEHYTYYPDKSAPKKLSEVSGEMKDGAAVISYAKGTDADIKGYFIYREEAGKAREKLADITEKERTFYYDKTAEEGVTYTYYVSAYDEEGYEGELSDAVILTGTRDESAPVIRGVEPADGILYGMAELTLTAEDNKELSKACLEVYEEEEQEYIKLEEKAVTDGKASFTFDTTKYKDEVTVRFTVYDKAGNQNETEFEKTYVTDNKGPAKINGFTASVTSTTAVLSWDAPEEDDFSHFIVEELLEDEWKEVTKTTTVTGCALEGLAVQSTHIYRVTGYDIYGNAGEPSDELTVAILEDTIAPRITSVEPNGGYFNTSIPLTVRAYDNTGLSKLMMEYL